VLLFIFMVAAPSASARGSETSTVAESLHCALSNILVPLEHNMSTFGLSLQLLKKGEPAGIHTVPPNLEDHLASLVQDTRN